MPGAKGYLDKNYPLFNNKFMVSLKKETLKPKLLAGAVGFEPTHADTKNRCLTAWLRPIRI